ncbi:uncharacterized protein BX664DRAFT_330386 [Halteromyces radiatus]|uniref:uncharacterized protein n=1 Tax=Halteromyces radiatus TaxID=101107 RepID=UPI002220BF30|nr:uncharacterized protein BX664DRAFT_330386 [Halteromyces radiatus]KAI8093713.1 hypothetical protein BX664DRAFT_330386 [Halteromyces radiatus]
MMAESTSLHSMSSNENKNDQTILTKEVNASSPKGEDTTSPQQQQQEQEQQLPISPHQQAINTLQEAFPSVELQVIEAIFESQHNNLDATFDILLGMSDPSYKSSAPTITNDDDRLAQEQQEKDDELLARQLAQEYDQQQQRQQRQQPRSENESTFSSIQEELPVIKERVIEAGNVAKKKIMDFYNSFMDQSSSNNNANNSQQPYQQQQYQEKKSLSDDMRGLRLSTSPSQYLVQTSTSDQQMEDDAAFARRLAMEDAHLERLAAAAAAQRKQKSSPIDDQQRNQETNQDKNVDTDSKSNENQVGYVIDEDEDDAVLMSVPQDNPSVENGKQPASSDPSK